MKSKVDRETTWGSEVLGHEESRVLFEMLLSILQLSPSAPQATGLEALVLTMDGLAGLGLLHPRVIQQSGPFSVRVAQRIQHVGRLALRLRGGFRQQCWRQFCRGLTESLSVYPSAIVSLGLAPSHAMQVVAIGPNLHRTWPVGSVLVRLLDDGKHARVLVLKCPQRAARAYVDFGGELFRAAGLLGIPLISLLVVSGESLWVVSGRLADGEFDRFLAHWSDFGSGLGEERLPHADGRGNVAP